MADLVNIKINGKPYQVPEGINLITAAQSVGIHIPNLCYLEGMKGIGACRMCLVEVGGRQMTACIMKTKEGMDIVTESEKIQEVRKFVIDLILSMHPLDCMTCTKAAVCNLQNYAYEFGIQESQFTRKKFGFAVDDKNPFIKRDPDYCILCGRCVRVCREQGTSVLDFMGRGVGSKVSTADDRPLHESNCTFCGSCVDVCPVNALLEADRWRKGREWEYEKLESVCLSCSDACTVKIYKKGNDIMKIRAGGSDARAGHFICATGRFGFDSLSAHDRLLRPMKRVNGKLEETSWDDALKIAAEKMKGKDSGIITSGSITNEDAAAIKAYAAKAAIDSIDSTVSLYGDAATLLGDAVDLETADLMVVAGLNPNQWERVYPALDALIRTKADRKAKVIVINSDDVKIATVADIALKGSEADMLKNLAKALSDKGVALPKGLDVAGASVSEDIEKAAVMYTEAQNPVIISSPALFGAAQNVAAMKGAALSIPVEANAKGVTALNLKGNGVNYKAMVSGGVKTLYVAGDVPIDKRPKLEFLIVANSHLTELAKEADLVLPSAAFLERSGTIVDYMGRLRQLSKMVPPQGEAKTQCEIAIALAKASGADIAEPSQKEIEDAVNVKAAKSIKPFAKVDGLDVNTAEFTQTANLPVVNGSRLLWLKETEKAMAAAV
ncbi:molybdopterin-dependent oxidoreductase [Candidatus Magnetominusculus xianensis]|uniref:NADH dehydrogenase n=1 Tax=Candidatus Magnetominusculus xianensis TaxID=1748249 RepID=A0ABR5SC80_9BACT|nr:molybdopterin-dependent oxidoreductase [Candidatus Magnetominusculus xianensis]KWT78977.1 NADH dehydrogenase [Candidatus Magnetominusculus xianensis]MBF0405016.1 molybdopterin-dependent oxidoreductase [Nitrospirota bacterium]